MIANQFTMMQCNFFKIEILSNLAYLALAEIEILISLLTWAFLHQNENISEFPHIMP